MRIQSQAKTAICALVVLEAAEGNAMVPVHEISQRIGISISYLEVIFKKMKKGGLVESALGPKGGYTLVRPFEEITIGELIKMVDEKMPPHQPALGEELWETVEDMAIGWFNDVTLAELSKRYQL